MKMRGLLSRINIVILILFILTFSPIVHSETLTVALQTHVLGGENEITTHYSGSGLLSAAWSGSECAIAYPDYTRQDTEQGMFLAIVGVDGKAVCEPIRLSSAKKIDQSSYVYYRFASHTQIEWDGSAFVVWIEEGGKLINYRIGPNGEVQSKNVTQANLDLDRNIFVQRLNETVRFVQSSPTAATYMELSTDGKITKNQVSFSCRGEVKQIAFMPSGLAALTRQTYGGVNNAVMLELFDYAGERISLPVEFPSASPTPYGAMHWNGNSLVCIVPKKLREGGVEQISYQFDRYGESLREPQTVSVIPPDGYYGKVNFDCELIWTGSQYLAVWDQGAPGLHSMENVYVRLLDESGTPIGDPLPVNPEPLDQANNGSCFIGDGFAVFSVEKGNHDPSITYSKIVSDALAPPNTPTPTPARPVPTPTKKPLFELPDENYLLWEGTLNNPFGEFALFIQGSNIEVKVDSFGTGSTLSKEFSEPLPDASVNITGKLIEGNVTINVQDQPRPWNDYAATIALNAPIGSNGGKQKILFTWVEVEPESTPTPWPTWNANDPTPTPLQGAPKVLWIVRSEMLPNSDAAILDYSYSEFAKTFERFGAEIDWKAVGEQTVSDGLLAPYSAVVFADTRATPPLSEDEQSSVVRYVRGGGSIFIIGQQDSTVLLEPSSVYATSVGKPFGIEFSLRESGTYTVFQEHPIIRGIGVIRPPASKLLVQPPAQAIAGYDNGNSILAVAEDGYGRVVAFSDEYQFYDMEMRNFTRYGNANMTFAKNIAAWLLRRENELIATPTPPPGPYANILLTLRTVRGFTMAVQSDKITLNASSWDQAELLSSTFNPPLPEEAVDVSVVVAQGDATAIVAEQPRPWNDYTVTIALTQPRSNAREEPMEQFIVLTWSDEISLDPTPTPFPDWNPGAPTPTPYAEAPQVLWIAKPGSNPDYNGKYDPKVREFSDTFYALGAEIDVLTAGERLISDGLLGGYQAVIFGDTRDVAPLTGPETKSVVDYVRGGGSIFVIGQQDNSYTLDPAAIYANSIAKPFGIEFSTSIGGTYREFARHPLTSQLKTISGAGGSILLSTPPAQGLAFADSGEVIFAAAEDGYGRVVAYTDEAAFESNSDSLPANNLEAKSHKQLASNIAAWLLRMDDRIPALPPEPTPTPTFIPGLSDQEGLALVQRMLKANEPWLNPKSIEAEYTYNVNGEAVETCNVAEGGNTPLRVGATLHTPLHEMFDGDNNYIVKSLGETEFNGVPAVALDVTFDAAFKDMLGFGGQSTANYSYRGISVIYCRLFIEREKAIPLFIGATRYPIRESQILFSSNLTFDPNFYEIDGGYAPRSFLSENPGVFDEEQNFQYSGGVWIFESGTSWYAEDNELGRSGKILSAALTDLTIEDANYVKQTNVKDWNKQ